MVPQEPGRGPLLRLSSLPQPAFCGGAAALLLAQGGGDGWLGYCRVSPVALLAPGAGTQTFTKRRRRRQPEGLLWDSVPKDRAVSLLRFLCPQGTKDGTRAWQHCPFVILDAVAVVARGFTKALGRAFFTVGFH